MDIQSVGEQKEGNIGRVGDSEQRKSWTFKWEHRSQETGRQQEAVMEARRKEEEWVRDWRRHTTIRQNGDQNLHLKMMGGQCQPWRTRGKGKKRMSTIVVVTN